MLFLHTLLLQGKKQSTRNILFKQAFFVSLNSNACWMVFIFFYFLFGNNLFAHSNKDSARVLVISASFDTSKYKKNIENIQLFNPVFASTKFYANTGNIGLATRPLFFDETTYENFNLNRNAFSLFEYSQADVNYYNLNRPLTNVFFVLGPKKNKQQFQFSEVIHSQNINERFNAGIKLRSCVSTGVYDKQQSNIGNLIFFTSFVSKTNNYSLYANFIFNKLVANENGGINTDSPLLRTNEAFDRSAAIANNLETSKNLKKNGTISIVQYINFGKKVETPNDTLHIKKTIASSRFYHKGTYNISEWYYKDSDTTSFFKNHFINSTYSYDKVAFKEVTNEFGYTLADLDKDLNKRKFLYYAGVGHSYYFCRQRPIFNYYNNIWLTAGITNSAFSANKYSLSAKYFVSGYNINNIITKGFFEKPIVANETSFKVGAGFQSVAADYLANNFYSNHAQWTNKFNATQIANASVALLSKKYFNTEAKLWQIQNAVYYSDSGNYAMQQKSSISLFAFSFTKLIHLGKLYINSNVLYQKVLSGNDVLRLPELNTKNSIYLQGRLFKNNLLFQIGADVFYNTQYAALGYNPATTQFYIQNNTIIGSYVLADFFLNVQIKTVFITIKVEHFNKGIIAGDYYMVPSYPMPDRLLKFGVNWKFLD